mgnify:CR=1 FL=1
MKQLGHSFWTMLLVAATAVQAQTSAVQAQTTAVVDAADYFTNQPYGWATCSDAEGTPYTVDGGFRNSNPKTVVLYSSGGDDRQAIMDAINFRPEVPDKYQPTEEIIDEGYAVLSFCYNEVTSDDGDFTDGLAGLVYPEGKRDPDSCGKIGT